MKTIKNNVWHRILLSLALTGTLASSAFGMNQDEVTAPDLAKPTISASQTPAAESITLISNDEVKYQVPLNLVVTPFRGRMALSQVLYNMFKDFDNYGSAVATGDIDVQAGNIAETKINIESKLLKKVIAIFKHLYEAKKYCTNIEDEASYRQILDREIADIFTGLPINDKRNLLFALHTAADYLDSQTLYDLCERQFISSEIIADFIAHPQEYVNQGLLAVRRLTITAGRELFNETQTLQWHGDWFTSATISHDGNTIVGISSDHETIVVWTKTPTTRRFAKEPQTLQGQEGRIKSAIISYDCNTIVSQSDNGTMKIWTKNPHTGRFAEEPQTLQGDGYQTYSIAISPDGTTIVSSGPAFGYTIEVWIRGPATLFFAKSQTLQGHALSIYRVAISSDGNTIVSQSFDGIIKTWTKDPVTLLFAESQRLQKHNDMTRRLQEISTAEKISAGGNTKVILASGQWPSTIKVLQRDYFNGTVSILQAMFIETINQAPGKLLDLSAETEANRILREIAASFNGRQAEEYVQSHVILPRPVLSRLTHFVRQHPFATVAAVGSAVGIGYATRKLWRKLF